LEANDPQLILAVTLLRTLVAQLLQAALVCVGAVGADHFAFYVFKKHQDTLPHVHATSFST